MATTAQYIATPKIGSGTVTTLDSSTTAPTTVTTVLTAGAGGSRIDQINMTGIGTTVAAQLRLFIHDGTTYSLLREIPVTAITPSTTTSAYNSTLCSQYNPDIMPILLPTGYSLRATVSATQTGSGIRVTAQGGDF